MLAVQTGHLSCNQTGTRCTDTGWSTYLDVFQSNQFQDALLVSVKLALMTVPMGLILGIGLAVEAALAAGLEPDAGLAAADIVISTLPGDVGASWVAAAVDAGRGVLLDASYHPWPTPLAAAWSGSAVASGRDMLLWQAVRQVELMTGRPGPADAMAAALLD